MTYQCLLLEGPDLLPELGMVFLALRQLFLCQPQLSFERIVIVPVEGEGEFREDREGKPGVEERKINSL